MNEVGWWTLKQRQPRRVPIQLYMRRPNVESENHPRELQVEPDIATIFSLGEIKIPLLSP